MLSIEVRHKTSPATKGLSATRNGAGMNQTRIVHLSTLFIVPPEKEWKVLLIQKVDPGGLKGVVDTLVPRSYRGLPSNIAHIGLGGGLNVFRDGISLITGNALPMPRVLRKRGNPRAYHKGSATSRNSPLA